MPSDLGPDDEEPAVQRVAAAVLDRRGEDVEPARLPWSAGRRRPRRAGGPPRRARRRRRARPRTADGRASPTPASDRSARSALSKTILLVLAAEPAEARLQPLADRAEACAAPCRRGRRGRPSGRASGGRRRSGAASTKKSSITSGTSRRSCASADLPTSAPRFSSRLGQPLQRRRR